jgi:hypothetical protein
MGAPKHRSEAKLYAVDLGEKPLAAVVTGDLV